VRTGTWLTVQDARAFKQRSQQRAGIGRLIDPMAGRKGHLEVDRRQPFDHRRIDGMRLLDGLRKGQALGGRGQRMRRQRQRRDDERCDVGTIADDPAAITSSTCCIASSSNLPAVDDWDTI
jgi:hypothetical protein